METLRVLIVDDDLLFTQMLPRLLRGAFAKPTFDIVTANGPAKALETFHASTFDLVLCDYDLRAPQNGLDVLRGIASGAAVRVLMTGHAARELPKGHEDAYDAFLEKPMTLREVVRPLAEILEGRLGIAVELASKP